MAVQTFTLPAGTKLTTDSTGDTLRADAVVVCDERDAWVLRAVLGLSDGRHERASREAASGVQPPQREATAAQPLHRSLIAPPEIKGKAQAILQLLDGLTFFEAEYALEEAAGSIERARSRLRAQPFSLARDGFPKDSEGRP